MTDETYETDVSPFNEGMKAYDAGQSKADCPYDDGTPERASWIDGFEVMALG